jgi:hypothetical protein
LNQLCIERIKPDVSPSLMYRGDAFHDASQMRYQWIMHDVTRIQLCAKMGGTSRAGAL